MSLELLHKKFIRVIIAVFKQFKGGLHAWKRIRSELNEVRKSIQNFNNNVSKVDVNVKYGGEIQDHGRNSHLGN